MNATMKLLPDFLIPGWCLGSGNDAFGHRFVYVRCVTVGQRCHQVFGVIAQLQADRCQVHVLLFHVDMHLVVRNTEESFQDTLDWPVATVKSEVT